MPRKIKMLGLALVAVLSMSAIAASGAQALEFTATNAGDYPVTVEGEQTEGNVHTFTYSGRVFTCESLRYDPIGTQAGPTTSIKVTPTYSDCHANVLGSQLGMTLTHASCIRNFTVGGALANNQMHIECSGSDQIQWHIYDNDNGANTPKRTKSVHTTSLRRQ